MGKKLLPRGLFKIDKEIFKSLYSDIGRPNAPINVLVSLELIKHLFNYTDE